MFVCLQKDAKQCCDAIKMSCTPCSGQLLSAVGQNNESNPSLWHHSIVMASFWRQTNIKISRDLGKMVTKNQSAFYNESGPESGSESSPRFITYRTKEAETFTPGIHTLLMNKNTQ